MYPTSLYTLWTHFPTLEIHFDLIIVYAYLYDGCAYLKTSLEMLSLLTDEGKGSSPDPFHLSKLSTKSP